MDYVILVTPDKFLITTKRIPIFKGEKNVDCFKFLFPISYQDTIPTAQIILPDGGTGKVKMCTFEETLYKGHLVCKIDITEDLTAYSGKAQL